MPHDASFWVPLKNNTVQCTLCPHNCIIPNTKPGICGVRENNNGILYTLIYGKCSSIAVDPIEKKPLFHFHPGSTVLSLGSIGCNFKCTHCQNYTISQKKPNQYPLTNLSPSAAIKEAKLRRCKGIAWTYNEPIIWHEYAYDTAQLAKKQGLYTVYVTNGYIQEEPLKEISEYLDAMNIDIKSFDESFYKKICLAKLEPVKQTCKLALTLGIHIELTYLVIPRKNDNEKQIRSFCHWVVNTLGAEIPVHFSRFHPDYQMFDSEITPIETLLSINAIAQKEGLKYIYLGNIMHGNYENTYCPHCGSNIIKRNGFQSEIIGLDDHGKCQNCSNKLSIII